MHLNTAGGKMSKSKGEFLTVSRCWRKRATIRCAYRLFCLQSHYRRNLVFTWENLDNAAGDVSASSSDQDRRAEARRRRDRRGGCCRGAAMRNSMPRSDNDLNTSLAITALYDVLKYKTNDETKLFVLDRFR